MHNLTSAPVESIGQLKIAAIEITHQLKIINFLQVACSAELNCFTINSTRGNKMSLPEMFQDVHLHESHQLFWSAEDSRAQATLD